MISTSQSPKLSIITICYNAEKYILDTFNSIREQTNKKIEYIVIDGGSTDSTLDLIKANSDIIDYWCSEPDDGIADAMNKGILKSKGDYIMFLHADDYFVDSLSVERILHSVESNEEIVVFDVLFESNGKKEAASPRKLNIYTKLKLPFCHQGVVCSRKLFDRVGIFDKNFRITMDYDFFLRAYLTNASCKLVPHPLSVFRDTGISSRTDWSSLVERFDEEKRAHFKNCNSGLWFVMYHVWWCLYPWYRKFKYLVQR